MPSRIAPVKKGQPKPKSIPPESIRAPDRKVLRFAILLAGIILGQVAVYGPSLVGTKILLPLDSLTVRGEYTPRTEELSKIHEWDSTLTDFTRYFEPGRVFAAREIGAGRLPLWTPDYFAGAPTGWPLLSPFSLLASATESPLILPWRDLSTALVAGLGMYFFSRRVLGVGFWPACIAGWAYPLTGFLVLWQGFLLRQTVCILPWLLVAVDEAIRRTHLVSVAALGLTTGLAVVSGQLDAAGQVLIVSGIFALWRIWDVHGNAGLPQVRPALVRLVCGWALGLMLAAPQSLPTVEYVQTGSRMLNRAQGSEERPPAGLPTLPQIFLPDYYGRSSYGTVLTSTTGPGNLQESAASAYTGVLLALFAAPLAFLSRRHRSASLFLAFLTLFGVSWALNIPGAVQILRAPGLNMMSHNRLVFATGFALVALAAIGLETLSTGALRSRRSLFCLSVPLALLCYMSFERGFVLPEPVRSQLGEAISKGSNIYWLQELKDVEMAQGWYFRHAVVAGGFCVAGLGLWLWVSLTNKRRTALFSFFAVCTMAELLWYAQQRMPQCDKALYYPTVPALEQVAEATSGRVLGYRCLPPNVASMAGLRSILGYDAVDPADFVDLILTTADPQEKQAAAPYARTLGLVPKATLYFAGPVELPSILDLLCVEYVVFRGEPRPELHPAFKSFDYFVLQNTNALPRAFIPRSVQVVTSREERLKKMAANDFEPRQTAFVEQAIKVPDDCLGSAKVLSEVPTRIQVQAVMGTSGLLILADAWNKGWHARLDGKPVPILKANHALRGVLVPQGEHRIDFYYRPTSFMIGVVLSGSAAAVLIGLAWASSRQRGTSETKS